MINSPLMVFCTGMRFCKILKGDKWWLTVFIHSFSFTLQKFDPIHLCSVSDLYVRDWIGKWDRFEFFGLFCSV